MRRASRVARESREATEYLVGQDPRYPRTGIFRQGVEHVENVSKAIEYNGEIIPLVELPTVEITAPRNTDDLVDAIIVDGEVYPSLMLEEVVITPGA